MRLTQRPSSGIAILFLVLFGSCLAGMAVSAETPQGFTPLFNGEDLTGWKGLVGNPKTRAAMPAEELAAAQKDADEVMRAHWKVVDGVLEFDGKGKSLCTMSDYGDFELYVDWKILEAGDSGIYLRGSPQVQIWDTQHEDYFRHGAENGSGAFWNNKNNPRFPLVKADKPVGQWNTFHIRMLGERATIKLNGQLIVDNVVMENIWERDKPIYRTGQIELQNHGNTLYFRNIFIREIRAEEANEILASTNSSGYESIFNGSDLAGWTGATDSYHAEHGAIVCREGTGGVLFTEKEYTDFIARHEFKLPPGGNNGLAIRYLEEGNAHLKGMCEIEILDDDHEKYAQLDPRQFHGSVYGLVAPHRGYLRPAGEWNFQQVTVRGSNIKIELNGTTIVDADVSKITESKDGELYENIGRKSGHFGFAGHNDPVAFRNISMKELPGSPAEPPSRDIAISPTDRPIKLFNGKNLEGLYTWIRDLNYSDPNKVFTVKDGMIHISGNGYGGLITHESYRDYHLIIEFKWGKKTWGTRVDRTRDSGILLHCWGPNGGFGNTWMASIEAQIIEGGVGDILVLTGSDPITGQVLPTSLTAEITKDRDGEKVWKKGGQRVTISSGRINWYGRDPDWADKIGFRGKDDVESPLGQWTRMEVIAEGGHLLYKVNGVVVNEAFEAKPDFGKILLQTEQAEMFVRRYELWPLGQAPSE